MDENFAISLPEFIFANCETLIISCEFLFAAARYVMFTSTVIIAEKYCHKLKLKQTSAKLSAMY